MLLKTGMRVIHIDVDRRSLHMDAHMLETCLSQHDSLETVLLIDHSFGYPDTRIADLRRKYPGLLIIEDCVRALGSESDGRPVGHLGDWALFSLYKTTVGNDHGAVLFTRSPYAIRNGPAAVATFREWASGFSLPRVVYTVLKRLRTPNLANSRDVLNVPAWTEAIGTPSPLCQRRFEDQLYQLHKDRETRQRASQEIHEQLQREKSLQFIELKSGCQHAAFFLSFTFSSRTQRETILNRLQRKGLFLVWAWAEVPAYYTCFSQSFPFGASESVFLSNHICHIPLRQYVSPRRRRRLIEALRAATSRTSKL